MAAGKGVRDGTTIHILQFSTQRYAMGDACGTYLPGMCHLRDVMCRGLTLHRGIGGQYQFGNTTLLQTLLQLIQTDLPRANTIQG